MGDALREALQGGIADKLDKEIIQGTNRTPNRNHPYRNNAQAAASSYADYVSKLAVRKG